MATISEALAAMAYIGALMRAAGFNMGDNMSNEAPKEHVLKTFPEYFEAVFNGSKTAEWRKDDREYRVGDVLVLREYDHAQGRYSGRIVRAIVTHILRGFRGMCDDFCMLSFHILELIP